jgi:hypothetical protein
MHRSTVAPADFWASTVCPVEHVMVSINHLARGPWFQLSGDTRGNPTEHCSLSRL